MSVKIQEVQTVVKYKTSDDRLYDDKASAERHELVCEVGRAICADLLDRRPVYAVLEHIVTHYELTPKK